MDKKALVSFIGQIELFNGLDDQERLDLISNADLNSYQEGDYLFNEHSPREYIYIIYEGEVELIKRTPYGKEERLAFFGKFDFLGEGSLMDDSPHSTSARIVMNSRILCVHRNYFKEHGPESLKIFSNVARVISRRMRHANNKLVNSAAQYLSGRTRKEHDLLGNRDVPAEMHIFIIKS